MTERTTFDWKSLLADSNGRLDENKVLTELLDYEMLVGISIDVHQNLRWMGLDTHSAFRDLSNLLTIHDENQTEFPFDFGVPETAEKLELLTGYVRVKGGIEKVRDLADSQARLRGDDKFRTIDYPRNTLPLLDDIEGVFLVTEVLGFNSNELDRLEQCQNESDSLCLIHAPGESLVIPSEIPMIEF